MSKGGVLRRGPMGTRKRGRDGAEAGGRQRGRRQAAVLSRDQGKTRTRKIQGEPGKDSETSTAAGETGGTGPGTEASARCKWNDGSGERRHGRVDAFFFFFSLLLPDCGVSVDHPLLALAAPIIARPQPMRHHEARTDTTDLEFHGTPRPATTTQAPDQSADRA